MEREIMTCTPEEAVTMVIGASGGGGITITISASLWAMFPEIGWVLVRSWSAVADGPQHVAAVASIPGALGWRARVEVLRGGPSIDVRLYARPCSAFSGVQIFGED